MIESLLSELGIEVIKSQGSNQLLCACPDCGTKHLYINRSNGLWDCKKGCDSGNPFKFVRKITGKPAKDCFSILEQHGLTSPKAAKPESRPKDLSWFSRKLTEPDDQTLRKFCQIKKLEYESLLQFSPLKHKHQPVVCIPAYDPSSGQVCGYLRAGVNGQMIKLRSGKEEKYPAVGQHGLYGLPWLSAENPETIIFTEAWRDAAAAIAAGCYATASSGGASTFKDSWLPLFRGRNVYIVMDADTPGQKAATRAAEKIAGVAKAVYTATLPSKIKNEHGDDLHDYLVRDSGDINKLLAKARLYECNRNCLDVIRLDNDEPDHVAAKIDDYCRKRLNLIHRYNSTDGWSFYAQNRYRKIEDEKEIEILIRQCLLKCLIKTAQEEDDGTVKVVYKPFKKKTQRFVSDIKAFWASLEGTYLRPDQAAPASLDGKFDPAYVLPLKNGLLDFSSQPYTLYPHSPQFYTFNYLDFEWCGQKDSELWIEFLLDITCGDEELFLLLQQWAGYLLKHSTEQQKFLLCYGDGANGKSVFFDVITALLGSENCSAVPLSKFDDVHHLTQTYGMMANITDESSKGLEEESETALKQYTGGTRVTFKRLYQQAFSAYPTAKIMIATNKLPRFLDTSNGIWRRVLLVPFKAVIPEEKQDKKLAEKIKASEMPGVLKWALEGLQSLEDSGGFIEPDACNEALDEYKREMNPLVVFLEENFEPSLSETDKIETKQLRNWYEQWCQEHGYKPKNDTNVGKQIRKLWPQIEKKRLRSGVDRKMWYVRLKLKDDSEFGYVR